jgi:hypothetical protein
VPALRTDRVLFGPAACARRALARCITHWPRCCDTNPAHGRVCCVASLHDARAAYFLACSLSTCEAVEVQAGQTSRRGSVGRSDCNSCRCLHHTLPNMDPNPCCCGVARKPAAHAAARPANTRAALIHRSGTVLFRERPRTQRCGRRGFYAVRRVLKARSTPRSSRMHRSRTALQQSGLCLTNAPPALPRPIPPSWHVHAPFQPQAPQTSSLTARPTFLTIFCSSIRKARTMRSFTTAWLRAPP